jgi:hypothetical protein
MAGGRPTDYSLEVADKICERIALGDSIRKICVDEGMPAMSTVFRWLNVHKEFQEQYARAKEEQAETYADEIVTIADTAGNPVLVEDVPLLKDGEPVMYADASAVAHARLKVDARKWVASKLKPKKYGERIQHAGDEESPIAHTVTHNFEQSAVDLLKAIRSTDAS